ncbi:hypothetical protein HDU67_005393, partial [Dinochytrium kinnereticum]
MERFQESQHISDVIPFIYGISIGHDPIRLVIGFAIQSLILLLVAVVVYSPLHRNRFYYAWDISYRRSMGASWVEQDKPRGLSVGAWLWTLVARKGSSFHLVVALMAGKMTLAIPVVLVGNYWVMWSDRLGTSNFSKVFKAFTDRFNAPPAVESWVQMKARFERVAMDQLDTTFH